MENLVGNADGTEIKIIGKFFCFCFFFNSIQQRKKIAKNSRPGDIFPQQAEFRENYPKEMCISNSGCPRIIQSFPMIGNLRDKSGQQIGWGGRVPELRSFKSSILVYWTDTGSNSNTFFLKNCF